MRSYAPRRGYHRLTLERYGGANAKASAALRLIRKIKREEEVKERNPTALVTAPIGGAWSPFILCSGVIQGDEATMRDGAKVTQKSLSARYVVALNAAETENTYTRVVAILDRRPERNLATAAMVWNVNTIIGLMNSADKRYSGRFQILYDKTHYFAGTTAAGTRNLISIGKFYIGKAINMEFTGGPGAIANCDKNCVLLAACNSQASHAVSVDFQLKQRFTDT